MSTQHTPGPWSIYDYGEEEAPTLVIHKDSATRICFMATPGSHGDPAIIKANAHLIIAAPDMLAALKSIQKWLMFPKNLTDEKWNADFVKANNLTVAAIAKAKGRS